MNGDLLKRMRGGLVNRVVLIALFVGLTVELSAQSAAPAHAPDGDYVREWLVAGPFTPGNLNTDFLLSSGGETAARPKESDPIPRSGGSALTWRRYSPEEGTLIYPAAISSVKNSAGYAYCEFRSERGQDALFQLDVKGEAIVWINGVRVAEKRVDSVLSEKWSFAAPLDPGLNRCLIKMTRDPGEWKFALRVLPSSRAILAGHVSDPGGGRRAAALVQLFQGTNEVARTLSDNSGGYRLEVFPAAGIRELRATSGTLGVWKLGIDIAAGARETLDLQLEDAVSISGSVLALDGESPQTAVAVQALPASGSVESTVFTDSKGEYRFINLKPGAYQIRCQTSDAFLYYGGLGGSAKDSAKTMVVGERSYRGLVLHASPIKRGVWRRYTTYDGVPHHRVSCIQNTANGAICFGMRGGRLCLFDGKQFEQLSDLPGLDGGVVTALARARDGTLWFGSALDGATHFDGETGAWIRHVASTNGLCGDRVKSILVDSDGITWVGTESGVSRIDGEDLARYTVRDGLPSNFVRSICQSKDGTIWFGTDHGASRFEDGRFANLNPNGAFVERDILKIMQASDGAMWFATLDGAVRYESGQFQRFSTREGLLDGRVNDILENEDGALWFATDGGASRFNGTTFVNFTSDDGLAHNRVSDIHRGEDGCLWFATDEGLSRLDPRSFLRFTEKDGIMTEDGSPSGIAAIEKDANGAIWIGGAANGLFQWEGDRLRQLGSALQGIGPAALLESPDGTLWLGSQGGLSRYDGERVEGVTNRVRALALGSDTFGNIWIGGKWSGGGVSTFDPRTGVFRNFTTADGLPHNNVWVIRKGRGGDLWLGGYSGLFKFSDGQFSRVDQARSPDEIEPPSTWAIHMDDRGDLWFGGSGGLAHYDGDRVSWLNQEKGLPKFRVWDIAQTEDGIIWVGTENHGLVGYDGEAYVTIDTRDGLSGKNVADVTIGSDGEIWVGTRDGGLTRYRRVAQSPRIRLRSLEVDESSYTNFAAIPPIQMSRRITFRYDELDFDTHRDKRQFRLRIQDSDGASVTNAVVRERQFDWIPRTPGDYTVRIQSINRDLRYSEPAALSLAISPIPAPWFQRPSVVVPAIGCGGIFIVLGVVLASKYLRQRREGRRLRAQMLERDHQARITLEEKNAQLEESRARLLEAKEAADAASKTKSAFLAAMSHELRTPLNAIIGYGELLHEELNDSGQRQHSEDLTKITQAGKHLLGLIDNILDLSKIEAGKMTVHLEEFEILMVLEQVVATVQPLVGKKGNKLELECPGSTGRMYADQTKVRQTLVNLLSNACKFTENGIIRLTVRRRSSTACGPAEAPEVQAPGSVAGDSHFASARSEGHSGNDVQKYPARYGDTVVFEVADTGIGMTSEQLSKLFHAFNQAESATTKKYGGTGLGLSISRRLCRLMGGELSASSEYGKGSVFTVTLPAVVHESRTTVDESGFFNIRAMAKNKGRTG